MSYHVSAGNDYGLIYKGENAPQCKKYKNINLAISAADEIETKFTMGEGDYILVEERMGAQSSVAFLITHDKKQYPYSYNGPRIPKSNQTIKP